MKNSKLFLLQELVSDLLIEKHLSWSIWTCSLIKILFS